MASAAMPSKDNKENATSTMVMPRSFFSVSRVHASHRAILQFRFCMIATELICVVAG